MQETYGGPGGRGNESGTCEHFEVVVIWSIEIPETKYAQNAQPD